MLIELIETGQTGKELIAIENENGKGREKEKAEEILRGKENANEKEKGRLRLIEIVKEVKEVLEGTRYFQNFFKFCLRH